MNTSKSFLLWKLGIAGLSLLFALAVYGLVRTHPPVVFQSLSLNLSHPAIFSAILGSAPSLFYTLAVGLLIGVFAGSARTAKWHCLAWMSLALVFELLQLPFVSVKLAQWLHILLPERAWHYLGAYWTHGTFDPLDMLAVLAGGLIALYLLLHLQDGERDA